jgi:uncharacterized protein DUF1592/uncharacterized protein DUF1595/uncharacterized protein DUF1588/uncharacterized protein DUF1585/uncharacterized protein DUF1587
MASNPFELLGVRRKKDRNRTQQPLPWMLECVHSSRSVQSGSSSRLPILAHIVATALLAGCNATVSGDPAGGTATVPSGGDESSNPASSGDARPVSLDGKPIYSRFLRLTNDQWENSVKDVLKLAQPLGLAADFLRPVSGTTDFDNNERVVIVNDTAWKDFQLAAEAAAAKVTTTDQALQAVVATTDAETFITTFGRRAFRRELSADEVTKYQTLLTDGASYSGSQSAFTKGAALVVAAMLQSPFFLYRVEMADAGKQLSGYELAAKLSLWIRDSTPTDAMLDAAKSGAFDSPDGVAGQAKEMLSDAASSLVMRKFHGQLYKVEVLDAITKTGVDGYSDDLIPEFKQASYLFFDRIFTQDLGLKDILTSSVGFAGPKMAPLYGVKVQGTTVQQVDFTDRPGWYSQAPFLALWAINSDPDSIHRGVRINLDTLCADPGVPTADLPPVPPLQPSQTNRQRYQALTEGCGATCHGQIINPIGFAFENFDGVGRARQMDNGQPVNTNGEYPFAEGRQSFSGAAELMQRIAGGSQAHECYAKKLASYALERDVVESEHALVQSLGATSRQTGASVKDVMLALVKTDAFRTHVGGTP